MPVIAIVGSPNANSYLTREEANIRLEHSPKWVALTDEEKDGVCGITASVIDRMPFLGIKLYDNQSREFPRKYHAYASTPTDATGALELSNSMASVAEFSGYDVDTMCASYTFKPLCPILPGSSVKAVFTFLNKEPIEVDGAAGAAIPVDQNVIKYGKNLYIQPSGDILLSLTEVNAFKAAKIASIVVSYPQVVADTVKFSSAILPAETTLPDVYKYGSVHAVFPDGRRTYHQVTAHNIVTGVVTVEPPVELTPSQLILHQPTLGALKAAQELLIRVRIKDVAYDPNAGTGVTHIKIDTSSRSYANNTNGTGLREVAARHRVPEQVMSILGPYLIYGKVAAQYIGANGGVFSDGEWAAT